MPITSNDVDRLWSEIQNGQREPLDGTFDERAWKEKVDRLRNWAQLREGIEIYARLKAQGYCRALCLVENGSAPIGD